MKNYILSVIAVAACGGVVNAICPDGEGKSLKKAVSMIMSLFLIIAAAKPLISLIKAVQTQDSGDIVEYFTKSQNENYGGVWSETLNDITSRSVEIYVSKVMEEDFGIDIENFDIRCEIAELNGEMVLEDVTVVLSGSGILHNPRKIQTSIEDILGCECTVIEEWG